MIDAIDQFKAALSSRGLIPSEVVADGRIHRCPTEGSKSGRTDGSYLLHLDGVPAGGFDNWRDGLGWQNWCARIDRQPTPEEARTLKAKAEATRLARIDDEQNRQKDAANRAEGLWRTAKPATNAHAYLQKKGVGAYGLRALRQQLVIPIRDADGFLWSLQFVSEDGGKRFLTGGRKRGCYFAIGVPRESVCICEGYATAASVFEATGHATAVAFDAGNLEPVARALRAKFPRLGLILCADNDSDTPGNPGISKAVAAARAVRGRVAIPYFYGVAS